MPGRNQDVYISAHECATRIGISIRALRLYEKHGLISPPRTSNQWRLYGSEEVTRLNEILALKSIGLSLREISKLLCGLSTDLNQLLALRRDALTDIRDKAERGLAVLDALQTKTRNGTHVSVDELIALAKEINMDKSSRTTLAWRRYEQMRPRTETCINMVLFDDYVGAYETADGTVSIVSRREGRCFYRIVGQPDIEIFPESDTEFFMKDLPVQVTFHRKRGQKATGLSHHQNGFVDYASRMDLDVAINLENSTKERIQDQTPFPGGEDVLRSLIEDQVRGEPDFGKMAPALAVIAHEQIEFIQSKLRDAGTLKRLTFKGVSNVGLDVYEAAFDHASIEWGFALTHKGLISHLYLRPAP